MTSEDRDSLPDEEGTPGSDESRSSSSHKKKKEMPIWQETILLVGIAVLLAVIIKAFFLQAFYIPSQSMEPGLIVNDRILVQKVSYWGSGSPQRGDVVVFKDPGGWLGSSESQGPTNVLTKTMAKIGLYPTGGHLVKRVIGVGGDHVVCCDDQGRLSINGHAMDESAYVKEGSADCAAPMISCDLDVEIPEGYLLMMGDNRGNSQDSTAHMCHDPVVQECSPTRGLVKEELVVGKVWALVWPTDRFHRVHRPEVFEGVPDSP
ncbi:signal peptidase I [Nocardioides sp. AE5]|uniref:signal peptidase I n=1 Tax=Nocardioides sp. AE5 TaxID=2962573 RepID=UPI002882A90B|nr:signal peptidase I [Nocardioides sp. AE5]MDT0203261.1 signal peptidase I [Nocardioides sp. AE5]